MVAAYKQSEQDIREAYALLVKAEERLIEAFQSEDASYRFDLSRDDNRRIEYRAPDKLIHHVKHGAWKALVAKMGIRSAMSIKRAAELDAQLEGKPRHYNETVEPLPEITEANILAMMETTFTQLPAMIEEAVKEVYDWLRPTSGWRLEYKTNQKSQWRLDRKIILPHCISHGYGETPFKVDYHRQQNMTALDNVFHMLDGKGIVKTYHGPLSDAITRSETGIGETDYFKFKCYGNCNLHLEFKRLDLVEKLNAVAGGMRLGNPHQAAA